MSLETTANRTSSAFYFEGTMYYSPNATSPCLPPPIRNEDYRFSKYNADLHRFARPEWWTTAYGWVAFVPLDQVYDGPFEPLNNIDPVAVYDGEALRGYGLDSDRLNMWAFVEEEVYQFTFLLFQEFERHLRPSLMPTPISSLHPEKLYSSPKEAAHHIRRCRDWFSMWIGFMSFRIACIHNINGLLRHWYIALPARGMCPIFVSDVRKSIVCDFTKQNRVGTYLGSIASNCALAEWLVQHNIPVWYAWTSVKTTPALTKWQPSANDLDKAVAITQSGTTTIDIERARDFIVAQEPWKRHFVLHDDIHKKKVAMESQVEREHRLVRASQAHSKMGTIPTYMWKWTGPNRLILRRVRLSDDEANKEMAGRPCDEMRYDPWCDQWDICSYWGASYAKVSLGQEVDDEDTPDYICDSHSSAQGPKNPNYFADDQTENEQYIETHSGGPDSPGGVVIHIPQPRYLAILPLDTCLRLHLGYTSPAQYADTSLPSIETWMEIIKPLGRTAVTAIDQVAEGSQQSIVAFVSALLQKRPPSPALIDLDPSNVHAIMLSTFQSYFFQLGPLFILRSSAFSDQHACGWNIAVSSSANALFICRFFGLKGHALRWELIETLVYEGIAFHTLLPLRRSLYSLQNSNVCTIVPIRLSGHQFNNGDYRSYISLRSQILLGPRGRAALLHGGIVTRLALEVLDWEDAMAGPSAAVVHDNIGQTLSYNGIEYGDDYLTRDELNLICGLCYVYTGQGVQQSMLSWWPLAHSWENTNANGYNTGYWSQKNEEWYLQRSKDIESQHPKRGVPMSSSDWRSYLKGTKAARTVRQTVESISSSFLSGSH